MKNDRRIFGYILLFLGILLPFSLTGLLTYRWIASDSSYEAFMKRRPTLSPEVLESYQRALDGQDVPALLDPFDGDSSPGKPGLPGWKADEVFAYLLIPKIDLKKPIYLSIGENPFASGLLHLEGSALPVGTVGGRPVIAGERGAMGDLQFLFLEELAQGDRIYVDAPTGLLTYQVTKKEIAAPATWEAVRPDPAQDLLTLFTCHPFWPPRTQRLLLTASRVNEGSSAAETATEIAKTPCVPFILAAKGSLCVLSLLGAVGLLFTGGKLFQEIRKYSA